MSYQNQYKFPKLNWKKLLIFIIGLLILTSIFYFPEIWKITEDIPGVGFIFGFFMILALMGGLGLIGLPVGYICYKGYKKLRLLGKKERLKKRKLKLWPWNIF